MNKLSLLLFVFIVGCSDDKNCFKFEVQDVEGNVQEASVILKPININDNSVFFFNVYDSIAVSMTRSGEYLMYAFNILNNNSLGMYCMQGKGPFEANRVLPVTELYVEDGDLKSDLFAYAEAKLMVWNITKSLKEQSTVFDTVFTYKHNMSEGILPIRQNFRITSDSMLVQYSSRPLEYMVPVFNIIDRHSGESFREYDLYNALDTKGETVDFTASEYFLSDNCLKPDKQKLAICMSYFPQINILDLNTGQINGFRLKGLPDFDPQKKMYYFVEGQVDDRFIYALYCGEEIVAGSLKNTDEVRDVLYVFDWNGSVVKKSVLPKHFTRMRLDNVNKKLYFSHGAREDLYSCDLAQLLSGL